MVKRGSFNWKVVFVALICVFASFFMATLVYAALTQSSNLNSELEINTDQSSLCRISAYHGKNKAKDISFDYKINSDQISSFPTKIGIMNETEKSSSFFTSSFMFTNKNGYNAYGIKFQFQNLSNYKLFGKLDFSDIMGKTFLFMDGVECFIGDSETTLVKRTIDYATIPALSTSNLYLIVACTDSKKFNEVTSVINSNFKISLSVSKTRPVLPSENLDFVGKAYGASDNLMYFFEQSRIWINGQGFLPADIRHSEYLIYDSTKTNFVAMSEFGLSYDKTKNKIVETKASAQHFVQLDVEYDSAHDFLYLLKQSSKYQLALFLQESVSTVTILSQFNNSAVDSIGHYAFFNADKIDTINIPASISQIDRFAFSGCKKLSSITLPPSLSAISDSMLSGCSLLSSINCGNEILFIGENAFSGCASLVVAPISDNVITVKISAFSGCPALNRFNVSKENPSYCEIDGNLFTKNREKLILYANGKLDTTLSLPKTTIEIANFAFGSGGNLKNIIIPNSLSRVAIDAFENNKTITGFSDKTMLEAKPEGWFQNVSSTSPTGGLKKISVFWKENWSKNNLGEPFLSSVPSDIKQGIFNNWMGFVKPTTKLSNVVIPGTHDSGMAGARGGSAYETQGSSLLDQLKSGARYFDCRATTFNGPSYFVHANSEAVVISERVGQPYEQSLRDILSFITSNPTEILIMDYQHTWKSSEKTIISQLVNILGNKILTISEMKGKTIADLTLGDIYATGKNIVVIYHEPPSNIPADQLGKLINREAYLQSDYDSGIHNGSDQGLINQFTVYLNNRNPAKINVLQSQKTGGNIKNAERDFRPLVNKFDRGLKNKPDFLSKVNIIMRDYYADDIGGEAAIDTHRSIIFLNLFKGHIKEDLTPIFKVLISYDWINSLSAE